MTLLQDALAEKKFDSRDLERKLNRNKIETNDVERMLKDLPDDSSAADWISIDSLRDENGSDRS